VASSLAFIGAQPSSYPVNTIYLWTSGPHEAVLIVALKPERTVSTYELQERLRERVPQLAPGTVVSFEAADLVNQVMSFGSPTPIEVAVTGSNLTTSRGHADKIRAEMERIPTLRDVQFGQALDYPVLQVEVDRERAGQLGVTVDDVGRSIVAATSSSRFVQPNYWADPNSGIAYQVQVEVPQHTMHSIEDLLGIPVMQNGAPRPLVGDVAKVTEATAIGEYNRYNQQRMLTITANVSGADLGSASEEARGVNARETGGVTESVASSPRCGKRWGLQSGLASDRLHLPAARGVFPVPAWPSLSPPFPWCSRGRPRLLMTEHLNVQSFMGAIMAIGVAVANAILLADFAERYRLGGRPAAEAAIEGATSRLRPILMTTFAMIAGMLPVAFGAEQLAPLGRAVIGGLTASTLTTLFVLPSVFAMVQARAGTESPSLDPDESSVQDGGAR
jgi:multidrug efflux pump subunit AcrB